MADLFVYENEQEIVSWSDLQWLPASPKLAKQGTGRHVPPGAGESLHECEFHVALGLGWAHFPNA